MAQEIHLSRLEPEITAQLLAGCDRLDPRGCTGPRDLEALTKSGQCFAATTDQGQAVYVIQVLNGTAWVSATKGTGPVDWSRVLFPIIEMQSEGCRAVAFQTSRRGLVRQAKRQGYEVTGWVMKKQIQ